MAEDRRSHTFTGEFDAGGTIFTDFSEPRKMSSLLKVDNEIKTKVGLVSAEVSVGFIRVLPLLVSVCVSHIFSMM